MGRSLLLQACADGVSVVWHRRQEAMGEVALLLGDAANAAAVMEEGLPGFDVSHVVCVASGRNARTLQGRVGQKRPLVWKAFQMSDWMRPEDKVDVATDLAGPLAALDSAMADAGPQLAAAPRTDGANRAVLVHCDQGHNRAPTLILAFLVRSGLSLREAYRQVLRVRPNVDPLPAYRQALMAYESERRGLTTVSVEEPFAMHISQLVQAVEKHRSLEQAGCEPSIEEAFDSALELRKASVEALLTEAPGQAVCS